LALIRSAAYEGDARYKRTVIPAQAGIQFSWVSLNTDTLDARLRGNDEVKPSTGKQSCQINGQKVYQWRSTTLVLHPSGSVSLATLPQQSYSLVVDNKGKHKHQSAFQSINV